MTSACHANRGMASVAVSIVVYSNLLDHKMPGCRGQCITYFTLPVSLTGVSSIILINAFVCKKETQSEGILDGTLRIIRRDALTDPPVVPVSNCHGQRHGRLPNFLYGMPISPAAPF